VTIVAPVTVIGDKDAKVIAAEIPFQDVGIASNRLSLRIDLASQKLIEEVKIVKGDLVLTPKTGFSGKKLVTVTISENGVDRVIQVPLTVLPEVVLKPVVTPTSNGKSVILWIASPNADAYSVYQNGKKVCSTVSTSCTVSKVIGPNSVIEVMSNGGDRTISDKVEANFKQTAPVLITRIVSATITKRALTQVDMAALEKVIDLVKNQGFRTIQISNITTTKKTEALANSRIAMIKSYILGKTGSAKISFEVLPPTSLTYFNNLSVKP